MEISGTFGKFATRFLSRLLPPRVHRDVPLGTRIDDPYRSVVWIIKAAMVSAVALVWERVHSLPPGS